MKLWGFVFIPVVLSLAACGNKQTSASAPAGGGPSAPPVDQSAIHRPEECPSNLSGEFVDRVSKQRRKIHLSKEGDRLVLSDDRLRYFVTGEMFPRLQTKTDSYSLYRAVCNQGAVRITFFHKSNRGELVGTADGTQVFAVTENGGVRLIQWTPDEQTRFDRVYDRARIRPTPPVRPRPRR